MVASIAAIAAVVIIRTYYASAHERVTFKQQWNKQNRKYRDRNEYVEREKNELNRIGIRQMRERERQCVSRARPRGARNAITRPTIEAAAAAATTLPKSDTFP